MRKLSRRLFALTAVGLAVVLFFAINIAAQVWLRGVRIDLTEHRLYTLSPGTRSILSHVQEPITLRFYFSRHIAPSYANVRSYGTRVHDLLQEYVSALGGKIRLEEIDPEPFTPAEDEAVAQGISGAPTANGDTIYFGLVGTNTLDGREVIAFFTQDREPYLEYDLTSAVYRLAQAKRPELGVIANIPLQSGEPGIAGLLAGDQRSLVLYQQLRDNFFVIPMSLSIDKIPDDINTLMLVHPADLTPTTQYAVDQFVMRGGHVIAFVDPYSEVANYAPPLANGQPMNTVSDLKPLLQSWGVQFDPTKVVAVPDRAIRVQMRNNPRNPVADYIVWLKMQDADFNHDDPVTGNLRELNFGSAGVVSAAPNATTKFTPIIQTTTEAALYDAAEVRTIRDPQDLIRRFQASKQRYVLAARVSGPAKSAFPDGPPKSDAQNPAGTAPMSLPAHIAEAKDINVIVMADSDIFDDRFWVQTQNIMGSNVVVPSADNGAFVQNAVENMMGSSDLISLRTRVAETRPFTVVEGLRRAAERQYLAEEQQLREQLTQTETRLRQLEGQGGEAKAGIEMMSPQSQAEIEKFRRDLLSTRARLREVQANLRGNVEALGSFLAFLNIALVPVLVAVIAMVLAVLRRRRRAAARGLT